MESARSVLRVLLRATASAAAVLAIALAVFAVTGAWGKPLDARTAALFITAFAVYFLVLAFRLFVKGREWDRPTDVAVYGAVGAAVTMTGFIGALVAFLPINIVAGVIWLRRIRQIGNPDRNIWDSVDLMLLWLEYGVIVIAAIWLATLGLPQ